ncbi:MAG: hypothetical protein GY804_14175 [Alphaproteobacteria bacterium]|nr:hypothetical protein [Alphaproteobacteria bacterium]
MRKFESGLKKGKAFFLIASALLIVNGCGNSNNDSNELKDNNIPAPAGSSIPVEEQKKLSLNTQALDVIPPIKSDELLIPTKEDFGGDKPEALPVKLVEDETEVRPANIKDDPEEVNYVQERMNRIRAANIKDDPDDDPYKENKALLRAYYSTKTQ